jgi:hypothetical protein
MIIFRVAQGIACTSQTTVSDHTIHGMPGHLKQLSIIRFQAAVSCDHPVTSLSQARNQLPLDGRHVILDAESNSHGILYESHTNSAGTTAEIIGPNAK